MARVLDRDAIDESTATDYTSLTELGKKHISEGRYEEALDLFKRAVSMDTARPKAYNLLGAVTEILGDTLQAQKYYRAALSIDPSYEPALKNLERTVQWKRTGEIVLGDDRAGK